MILSKHKVTGYFTGYIERKGRKGGEHEKSKTDFALNLICKYPKYKIPQYIKDGLVWLNEQKVLEERGIIKWTKISKKIITILIKKKPIL